MSQPADPTGPPLANGLFRSAAAMRAAHNELIQRRREQGINARPITMSGEEGRALTAFANDAIAFVRGGCRTGAILDDEEERMGAQSMLIFWANFLQRIGYDIDESVLADFDPSMAPDLPEDLCPYLGLDSFRESDRRRFFGRAQLTQQFVQRLESARSLLVVGPSGSGKSSLVRAGLLPALRDGTLPGSAGWRYLPPMIPSTDPILSLARAIYPDARSYQALEIARRLRDDPESVLAMIGGDSGAPAVLLVDQFEELFTLAEREADRAAFIRAILAIVGAAAPQHRIVLTMRSDFETFALAVPELKPLVEETRAPVTPLSPAELREAIEAPAQDIGLKFESGVVDLLVQELAGEPAGLPLLQFTLLKLWEQREHNRITLAAYERVGGGRQALARSADAFYEALIPEDQVSTRRILLRMVRPGDGLEVTSSRVRLDELSVGGEDPGRINRVIQKLVAARLVRLTHDEAGRPSQLEVSHEALVRNWPRLVGWLEDEKLALATRRRLEQRAQEWQRLGSGSAGLLDETQLREAEHWVASPEALYLGYDPVLARLIVASSEALREAEDAREAIRERELAQARALAEEQRARAEAEAARADSQRRSAVWLRVLLAGMAALAVAALYLGTQAIASAARETSLKATAVLSAATNASLAATSDALRQTAEAQSELERSLGRTAVAAQGEAQRSAEQANIQRIAAETQRNLARAGELSAQAQEALASRPQRGLLLAVAAAQVGDSPAEIASAALIAALARTDGVGIGMAPGPIVAAAMTADGALLASADESGTLALWDAAADPGAALLATVRDLGEAARFAALSDDGRWAAIAGTARALVYPIKASAGIDAPKELTNLPENISALGIGPASPGGPRWLIIAGGDGSIRGWRLDGAALSGPTLFSSAEQPTGAIRALAFSPDGRWLASGGADRVTRLWDLTATQAANRFVTRLNPRAGAITALAFSADSRWIAAGAADSTIHLWRVGGGGFSSGPFVKTGPIGSITALVFSPDGAWLLSGSSDRNARLWSADAFATNGAEAVVLTGHSQAITALAFSPDSLLAVTASSDRDILIWPIRLLRAEPYRLHGHEQTVQALLATSDGLLSAGRDGQLRRWDLPPRTADQRAAFVAGLSLDDQMRDACLAAGRRLTDEEIRQFFGDAPAALPCQ
ncbi:hypothetical protein K2Z83_05460 [Oscillochloris sp. ZM17-4]|uniref:nSTAND1 domain-containing NTPase n=1 Tax=Oscillochloris sp. ZM17-4 TaxID=2866714 RepID=UPI001C7342D7|nr:AAA family ATPase [Oscillochloris sp. ZM17-4]MBX0327128.1 hypothetical protein [Oscillochloris sp. ZM17-4]